MMKFSLKTVLIFSFSVIISLSTILIISLSYYSSKDSMTKHSYKIMEHISDFALDKSKSFIFAARDAAKLTQRLESKDVVNSENIDGMQRYFFEQLQLNKQFSGIYYANVSGDFLMVMKNKRGYLTKIITTNSKSREVLKIQNDITMKKIDSTIDKNDNYDPRVRPWYILAVKSKKLIWTEPYVFFTSKKPGITTATPIYQNDGKLKGVVGVDIEIDELSNFISNLKISTNGKVFIMDKSLKMLSFPVLTKEKTKPRLLKIDEIDDKVIKGAYKELIKSTTLDLIQNKKFITCKIEGKNYHTLFIPFNINNIKWIIGMYLPEDDYLGLIKENQKFNILITIIIGIFSLIIGYKISQMISNPIARLQNMAHQLKELHLNTPSIKESSFIEINEAIESFNMMKESLKASYNDTLFRLALASEYKDSSTAEHIKRIGIYSEIVAREYGMSEDDIYTLKQASPMHDVGKIGISDDVLLKPSKLNQEEREIIETHPMIGAKILKDPTSSIMTKAREISMYHHERWDGSGYPFGLKEEEIPLFARIVAVVDVFDALVSKRDYKEPMDIEKAKNYIIKKSGTHFDPKCVEAFINSFDKIAKIHSKMLKF